MTKSLSDYTDEELKQELKDRRRRREHKKGCCYCGRPMSDEFACDTNPFSGYHVESSHPPTEPARKE